MERRILIEKTGISDKNISAKLNSLEVKGLIISERTRKGRTVNRWVQATESGKLYELGKIVIAKKPTKIPIEKGDICDRCGKRKMSFRLYGSYGSICDKCYAEVIAIQSYVKKYGHMPPEKKPKVKAITKAKIEKAKKPKMIRPEEIKAKPLPEAKELKKELRLLINLVLTHRKEEYTKYGYKTVSEIRSQIDTLIDELGS